LNELFNGALRTSEAILELVKQYEDIRHQSLLGVISNYFWEGTAMKIPEKITSVGFVSRAWLNPISQAHASETFFK
jgi:hypothetical protein